MIAVGGVGGSGTRVFCAILKSLGVHMGDDLNPSEDNLAFTLLFKNGRAFSRVSPDAPPRVLDRWRWRLFVQHLKGGPRRNLLHWLAARHARRAARMTGHDIGRAIDVEWTEARWQRFRKSAHPRVSAVGFKEPNSHVYLRLMLDEEPTLRYVHVIRHGLDMAFSSNLQQLVNWGVQFGIDVDPSRPTPTAAFTYWTVANRRIQALARQHPGRILVVRFEDLCAKPVETVREMAAFTELGVDEHALEQAAALVQPPTPLHRYQDHDLREFSDAGPALQEFGYAQ